MEISYKPLMRQLLERGMVKTDLPEAETTLSKLGKNPPVKPGYACKNCKRSLTN